MPNNFVEVEDFIKFLLELHRPMRVRGRNSATIASKFVPLLQRLDDQGVMIPYQSRSHG
jgi:hypothetical protein